MTACVRGPSAESFRGDHGLAREVDMSLTPGALAEKPGDAEYLAYMPHLSLVDQLIYGVQLG